jgi:hypothetical protein
MNTRDLADLMLRREFTTLRDGMASDVVLVSPITSMFRFEGRDEVMAVLELVRDTVEDLEYLDAFERGREGVLTFRARVGRQALEGTDLVHLDDDCRIREIKVFVRPLPALAALAGALAPPLARRRGGRARATLLRVLVGPLVGFNRFGDALGARLVR